MTERMNAYARSIALGILILLIGIGAFGRFYQARFSGLVSTQAMELGDIAQQLRFGNGLSTQVVYPAALSIATPDSEGVVPQSRYAPAYPFLLSLLFRIRGGGDASVAMFNGLVFLITGWVIYALGMRLWDKGIGILAVIIYFVSVEALGSALQASGVSLTALLLLTTLWATVRHRQQQAEATDRGRSVTGWRKLSGPALVGALFGATCLSGGATALLIVPLLFLISPRKGRRPAAATMLIVAVLVVTPWVVRNIIVSGTPLAALTQKAVISYTDSYPEDSFLMKLPGELPSAMSFAVSHPREMLKKAAWGVTRAYRAVPGAVSPYLFPFFVLGGFWFAGQSLRRELWRAVVAMAVLQVAALMLLDHPTHTLRILTPIMTCLAVGAGVQKVRDLELSRRSQWLLGAALIALVLFASAGSMVLGGRVEADDSLQSLSILREHLAGDAVIASDVPAKVAWYTHNPSVLLPETPDDLERLEQRGVTVDYIYLSNGVTGSRFRPAFRAWRELLASDRLAQMGEVLPLPARELAIERHNKRLTQPAE